MPGVGGIEPKKQVAYFEYDFALDGGAVGDIVMRGDALPEGAVVTDGVVDVQAAVTSGGLATVAIQLEAADDVLAATGKATLALDALVDVVPDGAVANMVRSTVQGRKPTLTIADADITAGKFVLALEYYQPR